MQVCSWNFMWNFQNHGKVVRYIVKSCKVSNVVRLAYPVNTRLSSIQSKLEQSSFDCLGVLSSLLPPPHIYLW